MTAPASGDRQDPGHQEQPGHAAAERVTATLMSIGVALHWATRPTAAPATQADAPGVAKAEMAAL